MCTSEHLRIGVGWKRGGSFIHEKPMLMHGHHAQFLIWRPFESLWSGIRSIFAVSIFRIFEKENDIENIIMKTPFRHKEADVNSFFKRIRNYKMNDLNIMTEFPKSEIFLSDFARCDVHLYP